MWLDTLFSFSNRQELLDYESTMHKKNKSNKRKKMNFWIKNYDFLVMYFGTYKKSRRQIRTRAWYAVDKPVDLYHWSMILFSQIDRYEQLNKTFKSPPRDVVSQNV